MTAEEKQEMLVEILKVVDKHISKSQDKNTTGRLYDPSTIEEGLSRLTDNNIYGELNHLPRSSSNKYGREFGISDVAMAKWKEEYRKMRVEGKYILDEVRNHPIDVRPLKGCASFDLYAQATIL